MHYKRKYCSRSYRNHSTPRNPDMALTSVRAAKDNTFALFLGRTPRREQLTHSIPLPTHPPPIPHPSTIPQRRRTTQSPPPHPPRQYHAPKPSRRQGSTNQGPKQDIKERAQEKMPSQAIPLHLPVRSRQVRRREPPYAELQREGIADNELFGQSCRAGDVREGRGGICGAGIDDA